jgi:Family of unknown function (DUF6476)
MRALKILVVVLGVLLVAGTAALVMAIVARVQHGPLTAASGAAPRLATLPAGSRVLAAELAGDRLLVRVALQGGGEQLFLFDARSGAEVAVLDVPAAK